MNKEIDEALGELRRQHLEVKAPVYLETRLRAATRSRRGRRVWVWACAAAVIAIAFVIWPTNSPSRSVSALLEPQPPAQVTGSKAGPLNVSLSPLKRLARLREGLSEFVTLPGSEAFPPAMETSILRVEIPKGDLRRYGMDVASAEVNERVEADFVVGEDGLARAVRFVR